MKRYPNLDILRLVLALKVPYTHAFLLTAGGFFTTTHAPHVELLALQPVPAFLCVSGFLIPASLKESQGYLHFAWKRGLRIFPALAVAFALVTLMYGTAGLTSMAICYASLGLIGSRYNAPVWSLGVEEIMYALHASMRRIFSPLVVSVCLLLSLALVVALDNTRFLMQVQPIPAFFAGNILYLNRTKFQQPRPWLALLCFLIVGPWAMPPESLKGVTSTIEAVAVVLLALSLPSFKLGVKSDGKPRKWADLSYGIYIYHWLFLLAFMRQGFSGLMLFGATMGATLPVAALSWYLVESQALKFKNAFGWSRSVPEPPNLSEAAA